MIFFFFKPSTGPVALECHSNNNIVVTQKKVKKIGVEHHRYLFRTTAVLHILLLMLNITHSTDQFLMQHFIQVFRVVENFLRCI